VRNPIRIAHYINQFFGGIGGEDKADTTLSVRSGALGPGVGLNQHVSPLGEIVATMVCGDNYFNDNTVEVLRAVLNAVEACDADVLVAGPAFNAGRYGFACGEVCKTVSQRLSLPSVTAMYHENPAVETYRRAKGVWIVPTGARAAEMPLVLPRLARLALRAASKESLGPAAQEGYIPSGRRVLEFATTPGAQRAVSVLLAKLNGQTFQTEIPVERFDQVPPAEPLKEMKTVQLGLITTSGLVPKGNPDGFRMFNATTWHEYRLPDDPELSPNDWELVHGGFNTAYAEANPNLVLPLDALRELAGRSFGKLSESFFSLTGVGTSLKTAKQAGAEIAASMRKSGVQAALLVAT
jgi:glycine reductase